MALPPSPALAGAGTLPPDRPAGAERLGLGAALALLAHAGLVGALALALNWRLPRADAVVAAELWSAVPQVAAPPAASPPPPPPAEPPPPPAPAPRVAPPPPPPAPSPAELAARRDAEIALEKAAQRKQAEQAKAAEEARRLKQRLEEQRLAAEKARQEAEREAQRRKEQAAARAAQEAEARRQKEQAAKAEAQREAKRQAAEQAAKAEKAEKAEKAREAKAQEERLARQREENLKRMLGQAGAAGSGAAGSTGTAARDSAPSASYAGRIRNAVRPNIHFPADDPGNPVAEVEVRAAPDGSIVGRRIVKPSANPAWDQAVLRALDRTEKLPLDNGRIPATMTLVFSREETR